MPRCSHTMRVGARDGSVSCGDCGTTIAAPWRQLVLADPALAQQPNLSDARDQHIACDAIGARHPRSRKLLTIFSALATGWLPWGVEWHRYLSRIERDRWVLCCGHSLSFAEAQRLVSSGLLVPAVGLGKWPESLVLTPAGLMWLQWNWETERKPRSDKTSV